jgi:hypothetical protein
MTAVSQSCFRGNIWGENEGFPHCIVGIIIILRLIFLRMMKVCFDVRYTSSEKFGTVA